MDLDRLAFVHRHVAKEEKMHLFRFVGRAAPIAAGVSVAVGAWTGAALAFDEAAQIELGHAEFTAHCASCHGAEAHGDGPVAAVLEKKPPDLTQISARYSGQFPTGTIQEIIDGRNMINPHGDRDMPIWGDRYFETAAKRSQSVPHDVDAQALALGRVTALVKFLESIQAQ
ncbi:cytochrome c [Defluviimonas sp. WL0024]|uniref:Cytochrome c n=1 Tax=Albidovulum salinarum TaxID=2984153 RepID=A0ABT2X4H8_9RHOB|nr:cytochrome c [Defluviimonas sp. WL0024]MCU9847882.1 cytochrome c [Defluviimonas sp. WL0024]